MTNTAGSRSILTAALVLALLAPAAAGAQDTCPNAVFRASADLPDCRAYEQVTPTDKRGKLVNDFPLQPATTGAGGVFFRSPGELADNDATPYVSSFASSRGAQGWTTRGTDPLNAFATLDTSPTTLAYSADGSAAIVYTGAVLAPGAVAGQQNLYRRDLRQPRAFQLVATRRDTEIPTITGTSDLSTLTLRFSTPLEPGDDGFGSFLYRWSDGDLRRVDRLDDPDTGNGPPDADDAARPLSDDGTRVTYTTGANHVYQWADGRRVLVSHPQGQPTTASEASTPVASPDGDAVTFVSSQPLTADSVAGADSVYRWDAATGAVTDLLAMIPGGNPQYGSLSLRDVSPDGRFVWVFVNGAEGNEYGSGVFLLDTDGPSFYQYVKALPGATPTLRFSPDGRQLAAAGPYSADGAGHFIPDCAGAECPSELVTYTAGDASGVCRTCGATPRGRIGLGRVDRPRLPTAVIDDGRVFFDTVAQLVPADVNGSADVYQYRSGDGFRLLSAGTGPDPAFLGGVDADGADVFIATRQRLVPADADGDLDVYDVRAGGGFADQQVDPTPAVECTGEACKPPPAPAPAPATVGASAGDVPVAPRPAAFSVTLPSKAALRRSARTGRIDLRVRVGAPGTVAATLRGRGLARDAASATVKSARAGTVTVRLRLSTAARRALRRAGTLTLALTVAYSERTERVRKTLTLTVRRSATKQKGGRR